MTFNIQTSREVLPSLVILPLTQNELKKDNFALATQLGSQQIEAIRKDFGAKEGEIQVVYTSERKWILLGIGKTADAGSLLRAFRTLSQKHSKKLDWHVGLYVAHISDAEMMIEHAINGLLLGLYQIGKHKTKKAAVHPLAVGGVEIDIITEIDTETALQAAERGEATADTQRSILELVDAPSNYKTPQVLADWAVNSSEQYGFKTTIWEKSKIEEKGLHALLAVNRGSETPATFIIMEYKHPDATKTVGLVGKGVTFDTGGLSLKPSTNMHLMKSDMGGAAAVLGTMELTAKLQLPINVVGIVPATDNSIGTKAIKPSDVINSYSGKTIEIIDTDAEGRLILADAIAYMVKHFETDVLIDLATLTGSAVRTFGRHAAALFSNDDALAKALTEAGERSRERVWRLPMWEEYMPNISSDVADVRNYSGQPIAGAIDAANFLKVFTDKHPTWAHLDIAGVAFYKHAFSSQKSATAYGIRLLTDYLKATSAT